MDAKEGDVPDCGYVENLTPAEIRRTIIRNAPSAVIADDVVNLEVRNESVYTISMASMRHREESGAADDWKLHGG